MTGIGIDTGGTYTDAVIYDSDTRKLLATAKSLTTKEDLKIGIKNVLEKLPEGFLKTCETISLSTTLATNACVENRGGKGKLVFIGLNRETLENTYQDYGIDSLEDVYILDCKITPSVTACTQPDWDCFRKDMEEFCRSCDCISVVQLFAKEHLGSYEKTAAAIIKECAKIPVILGHELFPDVNIIRRGAGALLNARLLPIIGEFLQAVKTVFQEHDLTIPTIIVKSDGSLMSEEYTSLHPVETLLCGPAASIIGAQELTDSTDALVVDMGGTTTDIAIIKNAIPKTVEDGIQVGDWKTFVKGLFIDTFALGGDTAVHYRHNKDLYLEKYRVIPLCTLATTYPDVLSQLNELSHYPAGHTCYMHEFFCLLKDIEENPNYSELEKKFCRALRNGPLMLENAAKAVGKNIYSLNFSRLEADSVIIRSGFTPTDAMHIKGDFHTYDTEASLKAARFIGSYTHMSVSELCDKVYDMVHEKLYCNLVRILLQEEYFPCKKDGLSSDLDELIHVNYRKAKNGESGYFSATFKTNASLIAVGAPTYIFIETVAKLLGTTAIIPEHAAVANAVGAIAGNVSVTKTVELKPEPYGYRLVAADCIQYFEEYEDALQQALTFARQAAIEGVKAQGASSGITTTSNIRRKEAATDLDPIFLAEYVSVTATGKTF